MKATETAGTLEEYILGKIWIVEYPVRFGGMDIFSRMTVIRLNDGVLFVHSPCKLDARLKADIDGIGPVAFIVAPGNYHHLYVSEFKQHYPNAEVFVCPGADGDVCGKCSLNAAEQPFYSPVIQERAWTSPIWYRQATVDKVAKIEKVSP